ncbi:GTP-binding protein [Candidatus Bathyarchaeota archaeon]|nr:GTP-binding protein [Candidatus Bathyarchaeota archaeon]
MGNRVSTGIKVVDNLLGGGFERGTSILIRSSPFVDATPIAQEWLFNRLREGDRGFYLVNNRPPEIVSGEMESYGWPIEEYRESGALTFIDAYSGFIGMESSEDLNVKDPLKFNEVNGVLLETLKRMGKDSIFIFDSLNIFLDQFGIKGVSAITEWNKYSLVRDACSIYIYTEWGYPKEIKSRLERAFDVIIDLKALKRIIASEVLTVSKIDRKPVPKRRYVPFKYSKPGGFRVYIPKILVTGPYHAGKTTIVHKISSRAVSVQRMGTTIALDFGHIDYEGFSIDLFGTIGQPRFDPILDILGGEAIGVLLVIDSTKPEEFPRAMEMMRKAGVHGLPYVVIANKQDLPGALSAEEIRKRMRIPKDIPVIEAIATEGKNLMKALDLLLKKLVEEEEKFGNSS